jgi:Uma2 family endonuclease
MPSTLYQWTLEEYEALAEAGERVFCDWRHPRRIELIRGCLKEYGEPAKLSLDEYLRMVNEGIFSRFGKKRVELIHGEILEMSPIGDPHEEVLTVLTEWSVVKAPKDVKVRVQCSVRLPHAQSAPEPDLVWAVRRSYRHEKPGPEDILLLVEVADSSLAMDTGDKAKLYASTGIRDYWVVNVRDEVIEVRRDPTPEGYQGLVRYSGREELRPLACAEAILIPDTLWE